MRCDVKLRDDTGLPLLAYNVVGVRSFVRHFNTMTWWVKSHSVNGMARTLYGQVRDRHSYKCSSFNAGCWIHLHEQLTTFYISLADVIPIVGGRSYKLRVYYAGHVNFIRLIRLVPRSSDIALRPSYVAIVRRQYVDSSPELCRSFYSLSLVSSRVVTSDC